jgi:structural maintenance of chromosomes protein 5
LQVGLLTLQVAVSAFRKHVHEQTCAELRSIEAQSELAGLNEAHKEIVQQLEERRTQVATLKSEHSVARKEARGLWKQLTNTPTSVEEKAIREEFLSRADRSLELLEAEIASTETALKLITGLDDTIIEDFDRRAADIIKHSARLYELETEAHKQAEQIQEIRGKWESELDTLVEKISEAFSHNFQQIRCAGQVSIHKDDKDYGQWAIRILVKFRENEQLSVLDSHRQSGGERSVSTIFYLMSLQSLAKSPFRVVDEINQGMDPRNERMVHERMVDIACAENTSQYFLITPKLLTGLKYHPRMVVHTIYSGAAMPEDNTKLDLKDLAKLALRVRGRA